LGPSILAVPLEPILFPKRGGDLPHDQRETLLSVGFAMKTQAIVFLVLLILGDLVYFTRIRRWIFRRMGVGIRTWPIFIVGILAGPTLAFTYLEEALGGRTVEETLARLSGKQCYQWCPDPERKKAMMKARLSGRAALQSRPAHGAGSVAYEPLPPPLPPPPTPPATMSGRTLYVVKLYPVA
jgi:hypothetical protein